MTRQECIQKLIQIGYFIPMNELELFHGRAELSGEVWRVDPHFDNIGNNTGHLNVNKVAALSTATKDVAQAFATKRAYGKNINKKNLREPYKPSIYRITSIYDDAVIFNHTLDYSKLSPDDSKTLIECLEFLDNYSITEYSPVKFEHRNIEKEVYGCLQGIVGKQGILWEKDTVEKKALHQLKLFFANVPESDLSDLISQIAGAHNAKIILRQYPKVAFSCFREAKNTAVIQEKEYSINNEVIGTYMMANHIVGVKIPIDSVTIGAQVDNYLLFALSSINENGVIQRKKSARNIRFAPLEKTLNEKTYIKSKGQAVLSLDDPKELIKAIKQIPNMEKFFNASSGVWEGYTVGEHTEAVLRGFENTYGNVLPRKLAQVMRLAIVIHDIEKGVSRRGDKFSENKMFSIAIDQLCNPQYAESLGVDPKLQALARFIAKESQAYTTDYFVNKNKKAFKSLDLASFKVLKKFFSNEPSENEYLALRDMCAMLQTCDSGAYTRYGIMRDEKTKTYFRGGSDKFTKSFLPPTNLNKTDLHMIEPEK